MAQEEVVRVGKWESEVVRLECNYEARDFSSLYPLLGLFVGGIAFGVVSISNSYGVFDAD